AGRVEPGRGSMESLERSKAREPEWLPGNLGDRMMQFNLRPREGGALKVLCLGAHSDDLEIGCGGTILEMNARYPGITFHWVVFSATGEREAEAKRAAELFAGAGLGGPHLKA